MSISLKTFSREAMFVNARMDFYLEQNKIRQLTNIKIALTSMNAILKQDCFKQTRICHALVKGVLVLGSNAGLVGNSQTNFSRLAVIQTDTLKHNKNSNHFRVIVFLRR